MFGFALATGDFNSDSFADLAAGAPFEDVGSTADAGAVSVLPGSRPGSPPSVGSCSPRTPLGSPARSRSWTSSAHPGHR